MRIINKQNKFRLTSKPVHRSISKTLDRKIKVLRDELQKQENIKFGRKSRTVTYLFASEALLK